MSYYKDVPVSELLGKTIAEINKSDDEIIFTLDNGDQYKMYHQQDCCEGVFIEDIIGDIDDLLNSPLTMAEVVESNDSPEGKETHSESQTWTFYKFATIKGYVTIRWWGTSNGYYSESVTLERITIVSR